MTDVETRAAVEVSDKQVEAHTSTATEATTTDKPADTVETTAEDDSTPESARAAEKKDTGFAGKPDPAGMLQCTAVADKTDYRKNIKTNPSKLAPSDNPDKIRRQVAFYFGDVNLPKDKFMWESTGGSQNKPVPLSTIVSFGRMRHFKPYSAIVEALKTSDSLDMTLSEKEGEELVKRKVPFDPVEAQSAKKKAMASSVYAKGFGDEWDTAQYDIEAFFEKYGEIELVKLRRTQPENLFKGSVFVQFVDSETADKFVELSPKWKDVHPLKIMKKSEYTEEKSRLIAEGKIEGSKSYSRPFDGLQQMRDGQRGRGGKFQGGGKRDGGNQNGHGHGGRGGRGRGRGRGGRGGRGGGRGGHGRDNKSRDRNGQADKSPSENAGVNGVTRPQIGTSAPLATAKDSTENNANGKRVRDEADGAGLKEPPAKKVSTEGVTNA